MFWFHTILGVLVVVVVAEANLGSFFGELFGGRQECPALSAAISTDNTSCGVRPTKCSASDYRTYDGSCNNLQHGWWGTPLTPYKRLLDNNYADGVHEFPKSKKKKNLPNPRETSLKLFSSPSKDDKVWTVAFMQYAQIIAHDLGLTAGVGQTNSFVACCSKGELTEAAKTDPRCAPIAIPKNDPYNVPANRVCMDFYRTESTKDRKDCVGTTSVAEPLTAVTHYMDASYIYGSNKETALKLREMRGGRLKSDERHGRQFPPQAPNPTQVCAVKKVTEPCYMAGDVRVNQNPELSLLQVIYLEHHNNIVDELARINPQWDDETLYQEGRRIVIAIHQNIFYYEVAKYLIGPATAAEKKIVYDTNDFINDYDPNINAAVSNEFSTAAFRYFHTEIQGDLFGYNNSRKVNNEIKMEDWMNKPEIIERGNNFLEFTLGLTTQPMSGEDTLFPEVVLNKLFKDGPLGSDLKAIDLRRGEDHGLNTYANALRKCCLANPKSFKDFEKFINKKDVKILESLYDSYEDVSLLAGMSLESTVPPALSGPVACCFLIDQFLRTRIGDQYWFENNQNPCSFKRAQMNEIRKTTFASLMCQVPGVTMMQGRAFEQPSLINPVLPCSLIRQLDLSLWKTDSKKGCAKD